MARHVPRGAIPEPVLDICGRLEDSGYRAWVVGGSLRDLLLGREVNDWDIATDARPKQVQGVFRRVVPTGIQHGTVTVLHRGGQYEVTTLRGETTYSDGRHPDRVYFVDEIEADLARRDFTVNAIAYDPVQQSVADPFDGLGDLDRRTIRAVGDPKERFDEDGLRVLRAARFVATLEFDLDPETEAAIRPALSTFRKVSHERVREEWMKALKAPAPSRAFEVMRRTGILEVTLPELVDQVGCEQNRYHAYDVWTHTLACLDAMEGDAVERLAALLHDLGKPRSRGVSDKTGDYTFYDHEKIGARMADAWMRDYRFSNAERDKVVRMVRHHLIVYAPEWTDSAVRRFIRRVGTDLVDPLIRLARADALAKGRPVAEELGMLDELTDRVRRELEAGSALSARDLAIDGKQVMDRLGIAPGPAVGRALDRLLERVLEDPSLNDRDRLLALLDEVGPEVVEGARGS
ncbi:MAG: CCA tRNA nucleotidyltransferase [Myxococcota bacterium]